MGLTLSLLLKHKDHVVVQVGLPVANTHLPGQTEPATPQAGPKPRLVSLPPQASAGGPAHGRHAGGACRNTRVNGRAPTVGSVEQLTVQIGRLSPPQGAWQVRAAGCWPLSAPRSCFLTLPGRAERSSGSPGLSVPGKEVIGHGPTGTIATAGCLLAPWIGCVAPSRSLGGGPPHPTLAAEPPRPTQVLILGPCSPCTWIGPRRCHSPLSLSARAALTKYRSLAGLSSEH